MSKGMILSKRSKKVVTHTLKRPHTVHMVIDDLKDNTFHKNKGLSHVIPSSDRSMGRRDRHHLIKNKKFQQFIVAKP